MSAIADAIRKGRPWLDRFTRWEYEKAYSSYVQTWWDPCHAQLEEGRADPEALARQVTEELEEGRKKLRFWNRGTQAFDEKHTVIKYLVPMLLDKGEDTFVACLHDAWLERWPKDPYGQATYQELRDNFVNVILGIQLKK